MSNNHISIFMLYIKIFSIFFLFSFGSACSSSSETSIGDADSDARYVEDLKIAFNELDWFKKNVKIGMPKELVIEQVGGPSLSKQLDNGQIAEEMIYFIRRDVVVTYNIGLDGKVVGISYSGFKFMINRLGVDFSGNTVNSVDFSGRQPYGY